MKPPLLSIRVPCPHSLAILLCLLAPCDLLRAADKVVSASAEKNAAKAVATLPNVIFILADDFCYGDVSCFNPQSKVKTLDLDALAAQGMKFTDARSPTAGSSVTWEARQPETTPQ